MFYLTRHHCKESWRNGLFE